MINNICQVCFKEFTSQRKSSKFCSTNCRVKHSRKNKGSGKHCDGCTCFKDVTFTGVEIIRKDGVVTLKVNPGVVDMLQKTIGGTFKVESNEML